MLLLCSFTASVSVWSVSSHITLRSSAHTHYDLIINSARERVKTIIIIFGTIIIIKQFIVIKNGLNLNFIINNGWGACIIMKGRGENEMGKSAMCAYSVT